MKTCLLGTYLLNYTTYYVSSQWNLKYINLIILINACAIVISHERIERGGSCGLPGLSKGLGREAKGALCSIIIITFSLGVLLHVTNTCWGLVKPGGGTMTFISSLGIDSELFHGMGLWWPEHWTRWQPQACLWVVSSRLGLAEAVILLLPGLADGDFTVDLLISAFELLVDEPVTKTTWTFRHYLPTDTLCKDSILFSIPAGLHINYFPLFHVKNIPSNLRFKHLWQETDSKSLINTKAHCEAQNLIRWVTMVTLQFSCTHIMISTMFTCALLSARRPRTSCQRVKGSLLPFPRVHYPASV